MSIALIRALHSLSSWNGTFPDLPQEAPKATPPSKLRINLPVAADLPLSCLSRTLLSRRSTRTFLPNALSLCQISRILKFACGSADAPDDAQLRNYPSAGAQFDVGIHLVAQRVEGLEPGIYQYQADTHTLTLSQPMTSLTRPMQDCFGYGDQLRVASEAAFLILMTISLQELGRKYGARAYRFALQESGHIAQNLALVAESLHCGAASLGAFLDDGASTLLGHCRDDEKVVYIMALGAKVAQTDLDGGREHSPAIHSMESRVLQILSGNDSNTPELHSAVEVYRQAGRDALDHRIDPWIHWRIYTDSRNLLADTELLATLKDMKELGWIKGFWHLHKADGGHHLRLRLLLAHQTNRPYVMGKMEATLQTLRNTGKVSAYQQGAYDPEVQLFGGHGVIELIHEIFMLESQFFPQLISKDPSLAYRMSLLWLDFLFRAIDLDTFEKWDVWKRVSRFRPFTVQSSISDSPLIPLLRAIADLPQADSEKAFCDQVVDGALILQQLLKIGQQLNLEANRAAIKIRASCSIFVVFHWNRLQLDGPEQATLCQLWCEALYPHGTF